MTLGTSTHIARVGGRGHTLLLGRADERRRLQRLVELANGGEAGRLLLSGIPGSGRSALLDEFGRSLQDADVQVLGANPVVSEAQLAYATLFDVCRPIMHLVDALAPAQGDVLAAALSLRPGPVVAPIAVGAALLALLGKAAETSPVVLIVDDIEAADAESLDALAFAVRRLDVDRVVAVFSCGSEVPTRLTGAAFEVLVLGPLSDADSAAVLETATPVQIEAGVRQTLLSIAQGNALALQLLPRGLSLPQLRGRWPLPNPLPSTDRLGEMVAWELVDLSPEASWALVVAAASLTGSRRAVGAALGGLGVPVDGVEELISRGLLLVEGDALRFARPLLRSVAYAGAQAVDRRRAHAALAEVIGGEHALEHRSWHLAAAADGADETAARLLEDAALAWKARGVAASAAAALDRAVALTPDPFVRSRRRVLAADALLSLGESERAGVHLDRAIEETTDPEICGAAMHLRGRVQVKQGSGAAGQAQLEEGARRVAVADPDLSALMSCEAALAASTGRRHADAVELAQAAVATARTPGSRKLSNVVLGTALVSRGNGAEGVALLATHVAALDGEDALGRAAAVLDGAALALVWAERYDEASRLLDRLIAERRAAMAFGLLPGVLSTRALLNVRAGRPVAAYGDGVEALRLLEGGDDHAQRVTALAILSSVEAALGYEEPCLRHVHECLAALGDGRSGLTLKQAAMSAAATLELSYGRPAQALEWLERLLAARRPTRTASPAVVLWEADLAEALILSGRTTEAVAVLDDLERRASGASNSRALGAAARCRGLLAPELDRAAEAFSASLRSYASPPHPAGAARTRLAWGERLVRAGRPDEARPLLEQALAGFDEVWAAAWSDRAAAALHSCGFPVERRQAPIRIMSAEAAEVALLSAAGFDVAKVARHVLVSESTVAQLLAEATSALGSPPAMALRDVVRPEAFTSSVPSPAVEAAAAGSSTPVQVQLQVLGGFRALQQASDITPPPGLGARLVKVLALADRRDGVPVDEVVDVLWPDAALESGRVRLRNVLSRLRQSSGDIVVREGDALRLAPGVVVDLDGFDELAKSALVAHGRGEPQAVGMARAALALHGGLLLPDSPYDSWAAAPRERVRRRLLDLLDLVADQHRRAGRLDEAVRLVERAIEFDLYDEERYLLAAEMRREQGRHGAALALLERARAVVVELGVSPSHRLLEIERSLRN